MSNVWAQFMSLLPSTRRWIGKVKAVHSSTGKLTIEEVERSDVPDIVIAGDDSYVIGDYIFIENNTAISKAPDLKSINLVAGEVF